MESVKSNESAQAEAPVASEGPGGRFGEILHLLDIEAAGMKPYKYRFSIWHLLLLIPSFAYFFSFMHWIARASVPWSTAYSIGIIAMCAVISLYQYRFVMRISKKLQSSNIVSMLAVGPPYLVKIYDYTPWPWSIIILGPRPRRLREWMKLFSRNLDWYLEEPRTLIRLELVGYVLGWSLYLVLSFQAIFMTSPPLIGIFTVIFVIFIPAALLGGLARVKRMQCAMLLRNHLREQLAAGSEQPGTR